MKKIMLDIPQLEGDKKPTTMINFLSDKRFDREWVKNVNSLWDLEILILESIEEYADNKSDDLLLKIFHLIEIWGGYSGRSVYLDYEEGFDWDNIRGNYKNIVDVCLNICSFDNETLKKVYHAIKEYKIAHIGMSFATKHVRFWTYHRLGHNMLPIYDKKMVNYYKKKSGGKYNVLNYWKWMRDNRQDKSLAKMEREIYNDLKNNNL